MIQQRPAPSAQQQLASTQSKHERTHAHTKHERRIKHANSHHARTESARSKPARAGGPDTSGKIAETGNWDGQQAAAAAADTPSDSEASSDVRDGIHAATAVVATPRSTRAVVPESSIQFGLGGDRESAGDRGFLRSGGEKRKPKINGRKNTG